MAMETMEVGLPRVRWSSVIPGAFCAVAIQIVLGLFGAAFGFAGESAGLKALSAVWEVLTPLVALFFGATMAVSLGGRRNADLNFAGECAGLRAISAVRDVLPLLVALFCRASMAVSLGGRRNAYVNGFS